MSKLIGGAMKRRSVVTGAVLAVTAIVGISSSAYAAESPTGDSADATQVSAVVTQAASNAGVDSSLADSKASTTVTMPDSPTAGVELRAEADAPALTIKLPTELSLSHAQRAVDGSTVYRGQGSSPDVAVQHTERGVRISTVQWSKKQKNSFTYALPADVTPTQLDDGRIELRKTVTVTQDGATAELDGVVGYVQPAWATDAAGKKVNTHYRIGKGLITQTVDAGPQAVYPIVADPEVTTQIFGLQVRIRWNHAETKTIATMGWGATGFAGVCAAAGTALGGPPGAVAAGALCLTLGGSAVYTAGVAQNSSPRQCLQLTLTETFVVHYVPWFSTYTGGYCR